MTYNGWTNYETWSVALIIDNDESTQRFALELTRIAVEEGEPSEYWTEEQRRRYRTADMLKDWIEEQLETMRQPSETHPLSYLWSQLVIGALGEVDWHEIADHYLDSFAELS